jgi:hypothetical protein
VGSFDDKARGEKSRDTIPLIFLVQIFVCIIEEFQENILKMPIAIKTLWEMGIYCGKIGDLPKKSTIL